jgi:hypothetical protein
MNFIPETINKNSNNGHRDVLNILKLEGSNQLPQEFITVGKTFEEALGRCTIVDQKQRSGIITYKDHLSMFKSTELHRIPSLTSFLNASSAVGGINKSLAVMAYDGIYVPEGAGIHLSKQGSKEYSENFKRNENQTKRENEDKNNNR